MKKFLLFIWIAIALSNMGCNSNSDTNETRNITEQEQIEKDFKDGTLSNEDYSRKMLDVGKRELERKYSEGEIEEVEYRSRKAAIYMESIYQDLAYSTNEDHLQRSLEIVEESRLTLADLLIFRQDGIVSMSNNNEQEGRHISSIDNSVRLDNEGRLVDEGKSEGDSVQPDDKQRRMGMVRPLFNQKACYACHPEDKRILGSLYIMLNVEDW